MRGKMTFVFITVLVMVLSNVHIAFAQVQEPGITPDSPLWGFDVFFDQVSLFFAFDATSKAKLSIKIADERLAEVKVMIENKKNDEAESARREHGNFLNVAKDSIRALSRTNSTEELEDEIEVERKLLEHENEVEEVTSELKIKIKVKGELTAEQQELINSILGSLQNKTGEVKIEIDNKKGETKIKIKTQTGRSDEEIEELEDELEDEEGVAELKREREELKIKAEIVGNQSVVEVKNEFLLNTIDKNEIVNQIIEKIRLNRSQVEELIEFEIGEELESDKFKIEAKAEDDLTEVEFRLKFTLNTTDNETIINDILSRTTLTTAQVESVLKLELEEEEEIEIEAEIENNMTEIKVEVDDEKFEFTLDTTDREAIISAIIDRTGLSREQIEANLEIKVEDDEEKEIEEQEEKIEIEAEIEKNTTEVKVDINDKKFELLLNTTDSEVIISSIIEKTNLTREQVEANLEIKIGE